jgi:hypothetical protein
MPETTFVDPSSLPDVDGIAFPKATAHCRSPTWPRLLHPASPITIFRKVTTNGNVKAQATHTVLIMYEKAHAVPGHQSPNPHARSYEFYLPRFHLIDRCQTWDMAIDQIAKRRYSVKEKQLRFVVLERETWLPNYDFPAFSMNHTLALLLRLRRYAS